MSAPRTSYRIVVGNEVRFGHTTLWAVDAGGKLAHTEPVCTVHVCAPAVFTPEQIADALNRYLGVVHPTPRAVLTVEQLAELLREMPIDFRSDDGVWLREAAWLLPRLGAASPVVPPKDLTVERLAGLLTEALKVPREGDIHDAEWLAAYLLPRLGPVGAPTPTMIEAAYEVLRGALNHQGDYARVETALRAALTAPSGGTVRELNAREERMLRDFYALAHTFFEAGRYVGLPAVQLGGVAQDAVRAELKRWPVVVS